MRSGAVHFMAGAEASPHFFGNAAGKPFYSDPELWYTAPDNRWALGMVREPLDRYATVQTYLLNVNDLIAAPLSLAQDAINGRRTSGDPANQENTRLGGEIVALSNGNFVVLTDDRSQLLASCRTPTAVIIAPDGSIVKESWPINPTVCAGIWSNLAAFDGGFCVRFNGFFYFYDNSGNLQGTPVDQHNPPILDRNGTTVTFRTDRGDETRIASHINSRYVFLAGNWDNPNINGLSGYDVVGLAVWDAITRSFVAYTNVNELTPANGGIDSDNFIPEHAGGGDSDRVHVAVDALNRIVVTYEVTLPTYGCTQVVARVLKFDPNTNSFSYLTPSFFPFINYETGNVQRGIRSWRPTAAMTTRQICIVAQGEIDVDNAGGPADTPVGVNFYTVFTYPDPQPDPTPAVTPPGNCPTAESIRASLIVKPDDPILEGVQIAGSNFVAGSTSVSLRARGRAHVVIPASQVEVAGDGNSLTFDLDATGVEAGVYGVFVMVEGSGCPAVRVPGNFTISDCRVPFADANGDHDVDAEDFAALQRCLTIGQTPPQIPGGCTCYDRNASGTVDADDIDAFIACGTGPGVTWSQALTPGCVP